MKSIPTNANDRPHMRSIRLEEPAIQKILEQMDTVDGNGNGDKRLSERYKYRLMNVVLHLQQPGDGTALSFRCATRNLSEGGISILHGGYVHIGSRCVVQLISSHGAWEHVVGTVVGCRYVQANVHEVRIRFDHRVDPALYCSDAVKMRVLHVEDDPSIVRLVGTILRQLCAEVDVAQDGLEALERVEKASYDVILMDMEMPRMNGFKTTAELRKMGYTGTIVAATVLDNTGDEQRCIQAGCDRYIRKPFKREDLAALFDSFKREPLFSSLADEPGMAELVTAFVNELPGRLKAVSDAAGRLELAVLEQLARRLKAEAGGYGFEPISQAAEALENSARSGLPEENIKAKMAELSNWCLMARASVRNTSAPGA